MGLFSNLFGRGGENGEAQPPKEIHDVQTEETNGETKKSLLRKVQLDRLQAMKDEIEDRKGGILSTLVRKSALDQRARDRATASKVQLSPEDAAKMNDIVGDAVEFQKRDAAFKQDLQLREKMTTYARAVVVAADELTEEEQEAFIQGYAPSEEGKQESFFGAIDEIKNPIQIVEEKGKSAAARTKQSETVEQIVNIPTEIPAHIQTIVNTAKTMDRDDKQKYIESQAPSDPQERQTYFALIKRAQNPKPLSTPTPNVSTETGPRIDVFDQRSYFQEMSLSDALTTVEAARKLPDFIWEDITPKPTREKLKARYLVTLKKDTTKKYRAWVTIGQNVNKGFGINIEEIPVSKGKGNGIPQELANVLKKTMVKFA